MVFLGVLSRGTRDRVKLWRKLFTAHDYLGLCLPCIDLFCFRLLCFALFWFALYVLYANSFIHSFIRWPLVLFGSSGLRFVSLFFVVKFRYFWSLYYFWDLAFCTFRGCIFDCNTRWSYLFPLSASPFIQPIIHSFIHSFIYKSINSFSI